MLAPPRRTTPPASPVATRQRVIGPASPVATRQRVIGPLSHAANIVQTAEPAAPAPVDTLVDAEADALGGLWPHGQSAREQSGYAMQHVVLMCVSLCSLLSAMQHVVLMCV